MNDLNREVLRFKEIFESAEKELAKVIVGMGGVVRLTLASIFAGGHVLLEGAPGLGKTSLVKSISDLLGLSFKRIQFTSDLMPSDIIGTQILTEDEQGRRRFVFQNGPIFAQIVLADEVNRAGPKTQSALLEAMEEKQVSVMGSSMPLPAPFFVLATQNPIELEGTYPLPEAQLDRFIFKLLVPAPKSNELKEILNRTTGDARPTLKPLIADAGEEILRLRTLVRKVIVAPPLLDALVGAVNTLVPSSDEASDRVRKYVRYGPGPRGSQAVLLGAKVFALLDGRLNLSFDDISAVIIPSLRHRLVLNYEADAEGITADQILEDALIQK